MQGSLFEIPSNWAPPTDFPNLSGDISFDLETRDPWLKTRGAGWAFDVANEIRGEIVGIGVGAEGYQGYFPIRHWDGGNLPEEGVFRWIQDLMDRKGGKVFHNALYDVGWMTAEGIKVPPNDIHDTQFLVGLYDENRRAYDLNSCMRDYTGEEKDESLLRQVAKSFKIDPKSDLWKLHSKYVGPYGEQDAGGTYRLFRRLMEDMGYNDIHRVYEMERALIPLLIEMRRRGVPVDLKRAAEVKETFKRKELEQLAYIKAQTGLVVRPGVPSKDAVQVLRHLGIKVPTTANGADSAVAAYLESVDNDVCRAIVKSRKYRKAYSDFIDSAILSNQVNGRIHASFHPMRSDEGGTVAGRFSSSGPNLQQVPARDPEIGPAIRSIYVGEAGELVAPLDYSSQEPRWTLHFAVAIRAPGAAEAARIFWNNPRTDYHDMMARLCFNDYPENKKRRRQAKDIFLGLCYGMGGAKLCDTLGLPTEIWVTPDGKSVRVAGASGKELLRLFDQKAPFVKRLQQEAMRLAKSRGYVKTYMGRVCHVEGDEHKALNRVIQGSAADQIKLGMLKNWKDYGRLPLMLVHDESVYSVPDQATGQLLATGMETCIPDANIPFVVDCHAVPSWGEAKK